MQLKKLDYSFYGDNSHLIEVLDNHGGLWEKGKTRGYGVVVIDFKGLMFAIPLRTNIRHDAAYITVNNPTQGIKGKGLDYSKAVLITKQSYISNEPFKIPSDERKKLLNKEHSVTQHFEKYVGRYIKAVNVADRNILNSKEYRHTTLQNYHTELGLLKSLNE
jgi:protein AbiQ